MGVSKFAVLLTSNTCEHIVQTYGGLDALYRSLLREAGEVWDTFPVVNGVFPSEEQLGDYDGFVVTGSRANAYAHDDWILRLCNLLRTIHQRKQRILGICFGHQVLSRALGGKVAKSPHGWEIGLKKVNISSHALLSKPYAVKLPHSINIIQAHQDQVVEIPPGGQVLGSSPNTFIEMFAIGEHVLGIQGHPEFTKDILTNLMSVCIRDGNLREEIASAANTSMEVEKPDNDMLQQLCKSFLKGVGRNHAQMTTYNFNTYDLYDSFVWFMTLCYVLNQISLTRLA